ncbi:MAG: pyridoxal 5'-phosphate synthase lyase subunit PdxS, partial [Candidatus Altiarchaeales archaeon]|nr:pyridoxal 5'-phosphate synthase lyase subunit PdxS [Candidatus Altiarchaeales archaeon]
LIMGQIKTIQSMDEDEIYSYAKEIQAPVERVREVKKLGRLQVVNFAAGGIATPADAALMMRLGADGNFVGSGIFKSQDPESRAKAIVAATAHYDDPKIILKVSKGLASGMKGIDIKELKEEQLLQTRGV